MATQLFCASIAVRQNESASCITERIACQSHTRVVKENKDVSPQKREDQYRMKVLEILRDTCARPPEGISLVKKFLVLAHTLAHGKAVAISTAQHTVTGTEDCSLSEAWKETFRGHSVSSGILLSHHSRIFQHPVSQASIVHPLIIALLAFQLGGPVNAANSAHAKQWKLPDQSKSAMEVQNFHMEGDNGDIFDDHRVTFVWEEREGRCCHASGSHHLFFSDESTPRAIEIASAEADIGMPLTFMYDSKNAALVYEAQDPGATRHSISLDFHVHTTPNDMIGLLLKEKQGTAHSGRAKFIELLTSYPTPNYSDRFHGLLFSPESLAAITDKLSKINVPEPPPRLSSHQKFTKRVEEYIFQNQCDIPRDILSLNGDIILSGTYSSATKFLERVILKARRDIHLPIGWDLFPQSAMDEECENARRYFRNIPMEMVAERLSKYTSNLTDAVPTLQDLLSTKQLQSLASTIETRSLELGATGFVSLTGTLERLPRFTRALGLAINGKKEIEVNPKYPSIDERDLQIYRTRCLYLFWCAEWLVDYLGRPVRGPLMLGEADEEKLAEWRASAQQNAKMLLRNWVAWSLFVEGLPKGGIKVRRSNM